MKPRWGTRTWVGSQGSASMLGATLGFELQPFGVNQQSAADEDASAGSLLLPSSEHNDRLKPGLQTMNKTNVHGSASTWIPKPNPDEEGLTHGKLFVSKDKNAT
jgi:hypothetical protein